MEDFQPSRHYTDFCKNGFALGASNYPESFIKNVDTLFNKSDINHLHYSSYKSL